MDSSTLNIILIVLWFLLPIVPAYLLFKLLPGRAIVTGPFKGMNINLGGAFAGYFLLFLVAFTIFKNLIKIKQEDYEVWNISGKVIDGQTNRPILENLNPRLIIHPVNKIASSGDFDINIIVERKGENLVKFPMIEVKADKDFMPVSYRLDYTTDGKPAYEECDMNGNKKQVKFKLIKMQKISIDSLLQTIEDDTM